MHQEDIDKIDNIQNVCKHLQILLLQNNLISKIENLHKLKRLKYLNLAINNIELIENLDGLESLEKLDLTLNFIGQIQISVNNLKQNYNLNELILTGNPCTDYSNYMDYVIVKLPQLKFLDGNEIKRSDRISAQYNFNVKFYAIQQLEIEYQMKRDEQKIRIKLEKIKNLQENINLSEDEISEKFWQQKSEHCPEIRNEIVRQHRKSKGLDDNGNGKDNNATVIKKEPQFFANCGRPYNLNQSKLKFTFIDEPDRYELTLNIYRYLATDLISIDVQPTYVRAKIKDKYFQLALNQEVKINESISKRSTITGGLLIIMPKLNYDHELHFQKNQFLNNDDDQYCHRKGKMYIGIWNDIYYL